jgi:hypothetical protein
MHDAVAEAVEVAVLEREVVEDMILLTKINRNVEDIKLM